jgi:hypothetical protein
MVQAIFYALKVKTRGSGRFGKFFNKDKDLVAIVLETGWGFNVRKNFESLDIFFYLKGLAL